VEPRELPSDAQRRRATAVVADHIDRHAHRLLQQADDATPAAWTRGLTIGDRRSDVRRLLEHALHDALHHLDDVEQGLTELRTDDP
jgi:hypothetical protein